MMRISESGVVRVWSESTKKFIVNEQRLKHYYLLDNILDQGCTFMLCPP